MTMLDRMRRHKGWLKWSLALVVLSFIFLYIPATQRSGMPAASSDVVASVEGREITVDRFRSVYNRQMQAYRQAYGANMDERMLKQLGIDQRILDGLIEEEAALAEAGRLGSRPAIRKSWHASSRCRPSRRTGSSSARPATARCSTCRTRRCAPTSSRSRCAAAS